MAYEKKAKCPAIIKRYIDTANECAANEYFDDNDVINELHFLAKVGQQVFEQDRIKNCNECHKLYFARRSDSIACSLKCSNAWHQREHRIRQKESV